jgi:hypothetical protein
MNKLALSTLMQWDNPLMFIDKDLHLDIRALLLTLDKNALSVQTLDETQLSLLCHLTAGSIDATIAAIANAQPAEQGQLLLILDALKTLSEDFSHCGQLQ